MDAIEKAALLALLEHDSRKNLLLGSDHPVNLPGLPEGMTARELEAVLEQAVHDGHVAANVKDYGRSLRLWTRVHLTVAGLRALGQWPPAGGEYREGPWDERRWGKVTRPLLAELLNDPPQRDVMLKPIGEDNPEEWQRWTDARRLRDAGLIHGKEVGMGLQDVRVSRQGRAALEAPADDPLRRARNDLDRGAKADAVTAAIDEALKPALHRLADEHRVERRRPNGQDVGLAVINDGLKAAGAYDESQRAEVYSWLAVRNVVDHGGGASVRDRRVERLIDGVEGFIEEMSSPGA